MRNRHSKNLTQSCVDAVVIGDGREGAGRADWRVMVVLAVLLLSGCQGKSLVRDNPVFSDLPPRISLVNDATKERSSTNDGDGAVKQVSSSRDSGPLEGNTVVAEINGRPLFVDDLIGSLRLTLQAREELTDDQRGAAMLHYIKLRLDQRVDEEIVLQALEIKVPEEQRNALQGHLETAFQQHLEHITARAIAAGQIPSRDEFDALLAQEGLSVGLLRETFFRIQMVNGYIQSLTEQAQGSAPDRLELLDYYREHIDQFTPQERLRWQEIRVSISKQGGHQPAQQRMKEIVDRLKSDQTEFGAVAREYSDSLSAEENGNRGWLSRGALRDKKLEEALFALPTGGRTSVIEEDGFFSIYRIARHEYAKAQPFSAVQSEIGAAILQERAAAAKQKVSEDFRAAANVSTIFDENPEL